MDGSWLAGAAARTFPRRQQPPARTTHSSGRGSWRESAACRHADPELFFPLSRSGRAAAETRQAKAVCAGCPVRLPCLTYALATHQAHGIWGGYDDEERRALHRQQREPAAASANPEPVTDPAAPADRSADNGPPARAPEEATPDDRRRSAYPAS